MSSLYNQLIAILTRYMSGVNAHTVLGNAVRQALLSPEQLEPRDILVITPRLDRGIRAVVEASLRTPLWAEINALSADPKPRSHTVDVRSEQDISKARVFAKTLCENAGAKSFVTQKVATAVSDLARNLAGTAQGGSIELVMDDGGEVHVVAHVTGAEAEVPDLDKALSDRYRTQGGVGRGLLGRRRR
jgi:serine/threonine-protein kinase RsbT